MNIDTFSEKFEQFADAPGAVPNDAGNYSLESPLRG